MKSYLSIDLDYFNAELVNKPYRRPKLTETELLSFFKKIKTLSVPMILVVNHDELAKNVNKTDWDRLINVDYHSDLSDITEEGGVLRDLNGDVSNLNEGTWVNFVKNRKSGIFEWRYPTSWAFHRQGRCEEILRRNFFTQEGIKYHNWSNIPVAIKGIDTIDFSEIVSIGICMSPGWVDTNILDLFLTRILPTLKNCKLNNKSKKMYKDWKDNGEDFDQFDYCQF